MKIKLAILEKDTGYLHRVVNTFTNKFAEKFELYSFTDLEAAMNGLEASGIEIFLANEAFEIDVDRIPGRCGFAYLVESNDIDSINGHAAIGKYQKTEQLHNQIMNLYLDQTKKMITMKSKGEKCSVFIFASAVGGIGNTTMAAACAMHYAAQGKEVLYLNLERFGVTSHIFQGDGQNDLHDVIYAVKSRRMNLGLKLQNYARRSPRGVSFYAQPKLALDRHELNGEEIMLLVHELKQTGKFDYIVIDIEFGLDRDTMSLFKYAQSVVMVSDGSVCANEKTKRAYEALNILAGEKDPAFKERFCLAYNRFSSKQGQMMSISGLRLLGGARVYSGGTTEQILEQIMVLDLFDRII